MTCGPRHEIPPNVGKATENRILPLISTVAGWVIPVGFEMSIAKTEVLTVAVNTVLTPPVGQAPSASFTSVSMVQNPNLAIAV